MDGNESSMADTDDPGLDPDKGPVRTCLVTRISGSPEGMLRFVATPDGSVTVDLARKLPGRGVWITARKALIEKAVQRRLFSRGLKADVNAPADLAERTEKLMLDRLFSALSMARKAGQVVAGFTKVESALNSEKVLALIHATDAAEDGVRKIRQIANRVARGYDPEALDVVSQLPIINSFSRQQLDLALGGENVIHAALLGGGAARSFMARWAEWDLFSTNSG